MVSAANPSRSLISVFQTGCGNLQSKKMKRWLLGELIQECSKESIESCLCQGSAGTEYSRL
jgi:hypothetical protein